MFFEENFWLYGIKNCLIAPLMSNKSNPFADSEDIGRRCWKLRCKHIYVSWKARSFVRYLYD